MRNDFGKLYSLLMGILRLAVRSVSRIEFIREMLKEILCFSGCDTMGFRLEHENTVSRWEVERREDGSMHFTEADDEVAWSHFFHELSQGHFDPKASFFTENGSFFTGNRGEPVVFRSTKDGKTRYFDLTFDSHNAILLAPFQIERGMKGILIFKSSTRDGFRSDEIQLYEWVAQTVGVALLDQWTQAALRERVKELSCLYGISQIVNQPDYSLDDIFQRIVDILPPAFQYPEIASARICFDERSFLSEGFKECAHTLVSHITVNGAPRGRVEVHYVSGRGAFGDNPFLEEEQNLIDGIAEQIALIVEGKKAEADKRKLEIQLRHADRLATIGELAAGVAHELNEPLGNILGFAQLARKSQGLPEDTGTDLDKIVQASLHAREIVKNLLIFARQVQVKKNTVNVNRIVQEALSFLEFRCEKEGIELERRLDPDLPDIVADPGQLHQVLINLVVNSIQAMPDGGRLAVRTGLSGNRVQLIVEDTGVGISEEMKEQIFLPFFTTKATGEGTGLGLAVVHGIVVSHGGTIEVESRKGEGTRFLIQLPLSEEGASDSAEGGGVV